MAQPSSGISVSLHPLPILNISEHLTRVSLQSNNPNAKVFGGLLGTTQGRDIEIMNTFEVVVEPDTDGVLQVDHGYFVTRKDQFRQVFPTFDFLGWYSIGQTPTDEDVALHKQFATYNDNPLLLQFTKPLPGSTSKLLPVTIYESTIEIIGGEAQVVLVPTAYEIETGEAERVAVDHASKPEAGATGAGSSLLPLLQTQRSALSMLSERVGLIVQYLSAVSQGTAPRDNETLRMIGALVASLGGGGAGQEFKEEFMTEYNDVLLTTYLATMTKQLNSANELLDKQMLLASGANGGQIGGGGGALRPTRRGGGSKADWARSDMLH